MSDVGLTQRRGIAEAEIVRPIVAHILPILLSAALVSMAAYVLASSTAPTHRASTEFLIGIGYEYTPSPSGAGGDFQQVLFGGDDVFGTEIQTLSSPRVVAEAIGHLSGPAEGKLPSAEEMLRRLAIRRIEGSNILSVSVTGEDQDLSLRFLDALTESYLSRRDELHERSHYSGFVQDSLAALSAQSEELSRERDVLVQHISRDLPIVWEGLGRLADDPTAGESARSFLAQFAKIRVRLSMLVGERELGSDFDRIEAADNAAPGAGASAVPDVEINTLHDTMNAMEGAVERVAEIDRTLAVNARRAGSLDSALLRDKQRQAASRNVSIVTRPYVEAESVGFSPLEKAIMAGLIGILAGCVLAVAAPVFTVRRD